MASDEDLVERLIRNSVLSNGQATISFRKQLSTEGLIVLTVDENTSTRIVLNISDVQEVDETDSNTTQYPVDKDLLKRLLETNIATLAMETLTVQRSIKMEGLIVYSGDASKYYVVKLCHTVKTNTNNQKGMCSTGEPRMVTPRKMLDTHTKLLTNTKQIECCTHEHDHSTRETTHTRSTDITKVSSAKEFSDTCISDCKETVPSKAEKGQSAVSVNVANNIGNQRVTPEKGTNNVSNQCIVSLLGAKKAKNQRMTQVTVADNASSQRVISMIGAQNVSNRCMTSANNVSKERVTSASNVSNQQATSMFVVSNDSNQRVTLANNTSILSTTPGKAANNVSNQHVSQVSAANDISIQRETFANSVRDQRETSAVFRNQQVTSMIGTNNVSNQDVAGTRVDGTSKPEEISPEILNVLGIQGDKSHESSATCFKPEGQSRNNTGPVLLPSFGVEYYQEKGLKLNEKLNILCKKCKCVCKNISALDIHNSIAHQLVTCLVCTKAVKNKKNLKRHIELHLEPRLECQLCQKKFHRKSYLQTHLATHSKKNQNQKASCNIRNKSTYKSKHKTVNNKRKPCKFTVSEIAFMNRAAKKGIRRKCCNITFVHPMKYKLHMMRQHSGNKSMSFRCFFCESTSSTFVKFSVHQRTHMNTSSPQQSGVCKGSRNNSEPAPSSNNQVPAAHLDQVGCKVSKNSNQEKTTNCYDEATMSNTLQQGFKSKPATSNSISSAKVGFKNKIHPVYSEETQTSKTGTKHAYNKATIDSSNTLHQGFRNPPTHPRTNIKKGKTLHLVYTEETQSRDQSNTASILNTQKQLSGPRMKVQQRYHPTQTGSKNSQKTFDQPSYQSAALKQDKDKAKVVDSGSQPIFHGKTSVKTTGDQTLLRPPYIRPNSDITPVSNMRTNDESNLLKTMRDHMLRTYESQLDKDVEIIEYKSDNIEEDTATCGFCMVTFMGSNYLEEHLRLNPTHKL